MSLFLLSTDFIGTFFSGMVWVQRKLLSGKSWVSIPFRPKVNSAFARGCSPESELFPRTIHRGWEVVAYQHVGRMRIPEAFCQRNLKKQAMVQFFHWSFR